jgi:hypothetical protein
MGSRCRIVTRRKIRSVDLDTHTRRSAPRRRWRNRGIRITRRERFVVDLDTDVRRSAPCRRWRDGRVGIARWEGFAVHPDADTCWSTALGDEAPDGFLMGIKTNRR